MSDHDSIVTSMYNYCARNKLPPPRCEYVRNGNSFYSCEMEVNGLVAHTTGRSKRCAKLMAVRSIFNQLEGRKSANETKVESLTPLPIELTNTDMVGALRNYCLQHDLPLPVYEFVQQYGECPTQKYVMMCMVSSIKRYAISHNKKDARQKASYDVLETIVEAQNNTAFFQNENKRAGEERYFKFKTFHQYKLDTSGFVPGVLLKDRHNFFTKFHECLKKEAMRVIDDNSYDFEKSKAMDVLKALKIEPTISALGNTSLKPMLYIDLNLEYESVFAGDESTIYKEIINYFRNMLY